MTVDSSLEIKIKEFALENAVKFNGKAGQGAVIGKLFSYDSNLKSSMKEIAPLISKIISEVNSIDLDKQKQLLLELNPDFEKQEENKKKKNKESRSDLPPLKNAVENEVVMRIAPEPSKYNHIGHAISFLINYMYAKRYSGKCILRFDDTNPQKEEQEFVDAMKGDVIDYLDIEASETVFASDRNKTYIEIADRLISEGNAYTCSCEQKDISLNRREMVECSCRSKPIDFHKQVWDEMKLAKNSSVLRLKIDMAHKNAVMRDPVIFRVISEKHYRQGDKFKVWPMYDFECSLIEGELGITHVLRSNEFESRIELQNYIRELCGFSNHPYIKQYARFEISGAITQGREIRAKIDSGEMSGWDDPRLVTLKALKRRGIVKETYYDLAKVIGMSKTNSKLDFSVISSINRKYLDASSKRFFFISKPIKINIVGTPNKEIVLDMHPDKELGKRVFNLSNKFIIEEKDYNKFSNSDDELVRLIDAINFKGDKFISESFDDFKGNGKLIIHFLPDDDSQLVKTKILMPDNTYLEGISEKSIESLSIGEIIQFQRFGFVKLEEILTDGTRMFCYCHD